MYQVKKTCTSQCYYTFSLKRSGGHLKFSPKQGAFGWRSWPVLAQLTYLQIDSMLAASVGSVLSDCVLRSTVQFILQCHIDPTLRFVDELQQEGVDI